MKPDATAWWNTSFIEGLRLSPMAVAQAVIIVLVAVLVSRVLRRALELTASNRDIDPGVRYSLTRLLHLSILVVAALLMLGVLGVDFGTLAVVGGALGIGIGFGLQSIAANFVAGLVLLFERPIRVGDRISLGTLDSDAIAGINGYVEAIRLRATTVITPDNITLIVPNQDLVTRTVVNWSLGDLRIRIRFSVPVAYDSDLDKVRGIMLDVPRTHQGCLMTPEPEMRIIGTADSALEVQLLVWIADPRQRGRIESALRWETVRRFRDEGIVIPFPQREIRVLGSDGLVAGPRDANGTTT
jgi:small-conductance mechanosensitive channel